MEIQLTKPVNGIVSQKFGEHKMDYSKWGYPGHNGIDYAVLTGTPVTAAADGISYKVAFEDDGYGNYICIRHPNNCFTYYAHLNRTLISAGISVKKGQLIGYSGDSGYTDGAHLHFALKITGKNLIYKDYVDPEPYFIVASGPVTTEKAIFKTRVVASPYLNIREKPNVFSAMVGKYNVGDKVDVLAFAGTVWVKTKDGYVAMVWEDNKYLEIE
jgi:murein DD-endopeptidase MepM/ murein hydrolase activator NlpD